MKIFPIGKWLGKKQLNFGLFHVNFPYPLKYFDWEMAREKGVELGSFRVNFMLCQHGTVGWIRQKSSVQKKSAKLHGKIKFFKWPKLTVLVTL